MQPNKTSSHRLPRAAYGLALLVALSPLLAACPRKPTTVPTAQRGEVVAPAPAATAGTATDGGQVTPWAGTAAAPTPAAEASVYFDYDSDAIRADATRVIATQGRRLATEPHLHLRVEGNTDERGSAEYNVALGERRAQAVRRALLLQGARADQLTTVSYGAARPAVDGHDEAAWSRNRRVDLVDEAKR